MNSTLSYIADSFAGVSCNEVRIEPSSARNNLQPSSTVSFTLPQSAVLRLSSFTVHAVVDTLTAGARIPDAMSLLARVEVSVGGQVVSGAGSYYNSAVAIRRALTGQRGDKISQHGIVSSANPYQVDHSCEAGAKEKCRLTFSGWDYGMLSAKPEYLDSSRCGAITVRLTFADPSVLGMTTSTPATGFTISEVSSTIEVVSIANPAYDSMMSAVMAQKGYLPICWKEPYVIRAMHNGITRAAVSSRSLDRVLVAFRNKDNDTAARCFKLPTTASSPVGFTHETLLAPCEIYGPLKVKAADGTEDTTRLYGDDVSFFMSFGGSRFPQYHARTGYEWPQISEHAIYNEERHGLPCVRYGELQNKAKQVFASKLNLAGSASPCISSGVNSKAQSLIIEAHTGAGFASVNEAICFISAETSALLMLGQNREVSLSR